MKNNNFEVALAKLVCPICWKSEEDTIIMNTKLTEKAAKTVKEVHGKRIGYMEKPCKQCKDFMKQGIIFIGIDIEKSDKDNIYRSGDFSVVKEDAVIKILKNDTIIGEEILKGRVGYLDYKIGIELGIFRNKKDKNEK